MTGLNNLEAPPALRRSLKKEVKAPERLSLSARCGGKAAQVDWVAYRTMQSSVVMILEIKRNTLRPEPSLTNIGFLIRSM